MAGRGTVNRLDRLDSQLPSQPDTPADTGHAIRPGEFIEDYMVRMKGEGVQPAGYVIPQLHDDADHWARSCAAYQRWLLSGSVKAEDVNEAFRRSVEETRRAD